ncbi:hypothetical protein VTK56DRAFT_4011 [Thermocarpiscus australiensis]
MARASNLEVGVIGGLTGHHSPTLGRALQTHYNRQGMGISTVAGMALIEHFQHTTNQMTGTSQNRHDLGRKATAAFPLGKIAPFDNAVLVHPIIYNRTNLHHTRRKNFTPFARQMSSQSFSEFVLNKPLHNQEPHTDEPMCSTEVLLWYIQVVHYGTLAPCFVRIPLTIIRQS